MNFKCPLCGAEIDHLVGSSKLANGQSRCPECDGVIPEDFVPTKDDDD